MKPVRRVKKPEQLDIFGGEFCADALDVRLGKPAPRSPEVGPVGELASSAEASSGTEGELVEASRPQPRPTRKVRRVSDVGPGSPGASIDGVRSAPSGPARRDVATGAFKSERPERWPSGSSTLACRECGSTSVKIEARAEGYELITTLTCRTCGHSWGSIKTRSDVCAHGVWIRVPCADCGRTWDTPR